MSYTVKRGDSLSSIAARQHVSLAALEKANPQIKNPNVINVGQKLNIPGQKDSFTPAKPSGGSTYTVKSGDSMSKIASSHGVSLAALEKANPQIKNPNVISVGQHIHIPGKGSGTGSTGGSGSTHGTGGTGGTGATHGPGGTGATGKAVDLAKSYLGRYETDLQAHGITQRCPTNESCANFVTSMLYKTGAINFRTLGVADLNNRLRAAGWHVVSLKDAKPGDVWICNGAHGESHTELVASNNNGHVTLIGSNNHPNPSNQQINYDTYSANISGSFILSRN